LKQPEKVGLWLKSRPASAGLSFEDNSKPPITENPVMAQFEMVLKGRGFSRAVSA
jgi:hypothetical protein